MGDINLIGDHQLALVCDDVGVSVEIIDHFGVIEDYEVSLCSFLCDLYGICGKKEIESYDSDSFESSG